MSFQVDRRGGREGKKSNKVGKRAALANKIKHDLEIKHAAIVARPVVSPKPHPLAASSKGGGLRYVDAGFNVLNRQFDRDCVQVLERAAEASVSAMVGMCTDFGKAKDLMTMCAQYPGTLYGAVGLHPDNIKRVHNMAQFQQQMDEVRWEAGAYVCASVSKCVYFTSLVTHMNRMCLRSSVSVTRFRIDPGSCGSLQRLGLVS
jgi:hypothetical protein